MQLVSGFDQLLFGTFGNGEVLMRILINHMPIRQHVGFLQRILFIQPFTVKLPVIFQSRAANFQRVTGDLRLRQAVTGILGLDHPAKDGGVVKGIPQGVATVFNHHLQFTGPLLSGRQRRMEHVLFGNTDFVFQQLGDDRHMAGVFKFAAFLPDKQRACYRCAG
ncbi:hypothetical protein QWI28_22475 [Citrobacter freundii]|nr:hypothetical protein [Citrobacter freundii]